MIDGLNLKKDSEMELALKSMSESDKKILDSVIKNDQYRLKQSNNIAPTPASVAKLPDIYGQGFLLIYNQLQELIGEKKAEAAGGGTVTSGLGAVFESLGIGMQSMGKGFEMLGMGLAAMGNPAVFIGIGAASLILLAIGGFIAGLAALDNAGIGPTKLISGLLMALSDAIVYLVEGLANVLSDNSELIEMFLGKFIEALKELPPILHELGPVITAIMPAITTAFNVFGVAVVALIENLDDIIDSFGDFLVKVIEGVFNSVTTAIERLAKVDGKSLLLTAVGVGAISLAIVAFSAAMAGGSIINFLSGSGLVEKLERFAELGPELSLTGQGMKDLAVGVKDLGSAEIKGFFTLKQSEVNKIIDFVKAFDDTEFKNSLRGLKDTLPMFESFSNSLSNMALGIMSLADLDDRKYDKALERVKEFVALSKEAGASLESITSTFASAPMVTQVKDAVFTLDSSDNPGAYFPTKNGLVQTSPDDNLTIIASTNTPDNGVKELTSQLAEKFDNLLSKLDEYITTIAEKEPDITILPQEGGKGLQMDELLRVGV